MTNKIKDVYDNYFSIYLISDMTSTQDYQILD